MGALSTYQKLLASKVKFISQQLHVMDARLNELIVNDMVERIDESYFVVDNDNGSCLALQEDDDVSNCK